MKPIIAVLLLCACLGGCANRYGYVLKDQYSLQSANEVELALAYADARDFKGADSDDCKKLQAEMFKRPLPHGWEWGNIRTKHVTTGMSTVAVAAIFGLGHGGVSTYESGDTYISTNEYRDLNGGTIVTCENGVVVGVTTY